MNHNRKKLLSLLTAGMLLGSLMIPAASAADITITGGAAGAQYNAYRLLDLTTSLKRDHEDHEGAHENDCWNYAYTVNPTYRTQLQAAVGAAADADEDGTISDEEIISAIEGMDADAIRTFADTMFESVKSMAADVEATDNVFSDVAQGYYLITETATGAAPDAVSLVMLDTAGQDNIIVQSKEGVPTLTKKIIKADGSAVDADSVAIGDTVKYTLTATMPDKIDAYETYKMIFHDKIGEGLTLKADSIQVTVDGAEYTNFTTPETDDECNMHVVIADVKDGATVTKNTVVVVTYECEVAETAAIGAAGNSNAASLEFTNNPYNTAEGTNETPKDTVKVFTFQLNVNKVDVAGEALAGANFKIQKKNADGAYEDYMTLEENAEATEFVFSGLDEGEYKLVETKVPHGYTKADDVEFEIVATMDTESDDPQLTALVVKNGEAVISEGEDASFTATLTAGTVATNVVNVAGFRLPITGGQGVYAIYAGGAVLLAVAGGAIVMKKRKDSVEADAE